MNALFDSVVDAAGLGRLFTDDALIGAMVRFEVALAEAQAELGLIPAWAAPVIREAAERSRFQAAEVAARGVPGGNPALGLVLLLREEVARRRSDAACWVHFGATSQDVVDTALMLQTRAALAEILDILDRWLGALAERGLEQLDTPRLARTLLQPALPITLGVQLAVLAEGVLRVRRRLCAVLEEDLVLQLGGAAGTLALFGERGEALVRRLAWELGLKPARLSWHTVRDRWHHLAGLLVQAAALGAKFLRDVALAMQPELGELAEPPRPGKGISSALPHKRNPVDAARGLAAWLRLPGLLAALYGAALQEQERGLGGWQAEWQPLVAIQIQSAGVVELARRTTAGLVVDPTRMRRALEEQSLVFTEALRAALLPALGAGAGEVVDRLAARARSQGIPLWRVVEEDEKVRGLIDPARRRALFDPLGQLASARLRARAVLEEVLAQLSAERGHG